MIKFKITGPKPTRSEVTLLTVMQIGASMAGSFLVALMQLPPDMALPLTLLALVVGAHMYVMQIRKTTPKRATRKHIRPLAFSTAVVHVAIGLFFIFLTPIPEDIGRNSLLLTYLIFSPIAGAIAYGLTLWGLKRALVATKPSAKQ